MLSASASRSRPSAGIMAPVRSDSVSQDQSYSVGLQGSKSNLVGRGLEHADRLRHAVSLPIPSPGTTAIL